MKKSLIFCLIPATLLLAMWGCKKGENDPGISLKSRTGRLAGDWTLSEGNETVTYNYGSGISGTTTTTYSGTTRTVNYGSGVTSTKAYTQTITIEKSGSYSMTEVDDGDVTTEDGVWAWVSGSKDAELADKEAIMLSPTKSVASNGNTTTYTGIEWAVIMTFDKLSSKEMIVVTDASTVGTNSYSDQTKSTMTYTKK